MITIDHLPYQEFKKFLKFAKEKEDGNFVVILRAGIKIYDKENNEKIADIYASAGKDVDINVSLNTGFGSSKKLLKFQKLEKTKEIYNNLKIAYKTLK